jgi:hypothetical protein
MHPGRIQYENTLQRISDSIGISKLTGHVPRDKLSNHISYEGNPNEEIRQAIAHYTTPTTKIKIREKVIDF